MTKSKSAKRKSKQKSNKGKIKSQQTQQQFGQSHTKQKQLSVQIEKVDISSTSSKRNKVIRLLALIPLTFLIGLYISYYPKNLIIKNYPLGKHKSFSDPFVITNPNTYSIHDIDIKINGYLNYKTKNKITFDKIRFTTKYSTKVKDTIYNDYYYKDYIFNLPGNKTTHIKNLINNMTKDEIINISRATINLTLSYKTPFIYPNINDTIIYDCILNSDNEVVYLPKTNNGR